MKGKPNSHHFSRSASDKMSGRSAMQRFIVNPSQTCQAMIIINCGLTLRLYLSIISYL